MASEVYYVTGATGLVGHELVKYLIESGKTVVAPVRNMSKAENMLAYLGDQLKIVETSLESTIQYDGHVDYVVHSAAPTDSNFFVNNPVETISAIADGTKNMLEFAKAKKVKSFVYLSSMEVYGTSLTDEPITEEKQFYIDPLNVRASYPMAKRLAETLVVSYAKEYGVPGKVARLAQVIGDELLPDDNRVIAQFVRSIKAGKDIEIATDGMAKQTYVSLIDSITGILAVLERGEDGKAYNIADTSSFSAIKEIAETIKVLANSSVEIKTGMGDASKYPPNRINKIDNTALRSLGWEVQKDIKSSLKNLLG
jgi:nucleoside-diphosphate-sugar epimerase